MLEVLEGKVAQAAPLLLEGVPRSTLATLPTALERGPGLPGGALTAETAAAGTGSGAASRWVAIETFPQ